MDGHMHIEEKSLNAERIEKSQRQCKKITDQVGSGRENKRETN